MNLTSEDIAARVDGIRACPDADLASQRLHALVFDFIEHVAWAASEEGEDPLLAGKAGMILRLFRELSDDEREPEAL